MLSDEAHMRHRRGEGRGRGSNCKLKLEHVGINNGKPQRSLPPFMVFLSFTTKDIIQIILLKIQTSWAVVQPFYSPQKVEAII